jgi:hypothetical protein
MKYGSNEPAVQSQEIDGRRMVQRPDPIVTAGGDMAIADLLGVVVDR